MKFAILQKREENKVKGDEEDTEMRQSWGVRGAPQVRGGGKVDENQRQRGGLAELQSSGKSETQRDEDGGGKR